MAAGKIAKKVLYDIADAIRTQNGTQTRYKPADMPAAIATLDGTNAGNPLIVGYTGTDTGVLGAGHFTRIGDAIRGQNGSTTVYKPEDMAAVILALSWDTGLKPRAVLLSDGTLEFNYLDGRQSTIGGTPVNAYEVDPAGYSSASARPWDGVRLDLARVVIDSSFASVSVTNIDYWFNGMQSITEVAGFQYLQGATSAKQCFVSCTKLETIWANEFDASSITSSSLMFYSCNKLVGGTGTGCPYSGSATYAKLGDGGLLTDPAADHRVWVYGYLYDDGELVVQATSCVDSARTLLAGGRLCANAVYQTAGAMPWYDNRSSMRTVTFEVDMASVALLNMCYWFYSMSAITTVTGLDSLANVSKMRYTFASCTGLTSLDFRGFDPSHLTDLFYCFSGSKNITTIYADSTWALPTSGISGSQCFYSCNALVGGNGTTWTSSKTSYTYFRIDTASTPGYLRSIEFPNATP
ncbi:hypothetical protein HMPREF1008_00876 [Olsenella sp. oral taxon 809 str. F0356]|uniref:BspA family leucine-rich repeat surface protein n=1 Tax=Olsenella sp. oral taxon 809 TaxID=661086 RepID=UPI000231ED01|nr:BspA family leucine-rich repeat surface protein [Olsenella sp. oral taxon 809]EHF02170.1 hypothetical protein HMPREF1008_00876 [Olsenella sp. oral taxon 809 str. F0356]